LERCACHGRIDVALAQRQCSRGYSGAGARHPREGNDFRHPFSATTTSTTGDGEPQAFEHIACRRGEKCNVTRAQKRSTEGAGRTRGALHAVAAEIAAAGRRAEIAPVDALDEDALETYVAAEAEAEQAGSIDISRNALSNDAVQGTPLIEMSVDDFSQPVAKAMRAQFLTARAFARRMVQRESGVILTNTDGYPAAFPDIGSTVVAWAAIEALCRKWARGLASQACVW